MAVVICVSNRLGSYPAQFVPSVKKPFLVNENDPDSAMRWYVNEWAKREQWKPNFGKADLVLDAGLYADPDEVYEQMLAGGVPWPVTYLFRPEEITELFRIAELKEVHLAGPGALARTLPGELLQKLLYTAEYREPFLQRCYRFDSEPSVCGMGLFSLVASGRK